MSKYFKSGIIGGTTALITWIGTAHLFGSDPVTVLKESTAGTWIADYQVGFGILIILIFALLVFWFTRHGRKKK